MPILNDIRAFYCAAIPRNFSVHVTVGGLRKLLVGDHFVLQADEHLLHGVGALPVGEESELSLDDAGALVHGRNVALRVELDLGRLCGVVVAAHDRQHVDSVVKVSVGWANDGAVPVRESLVSRCIQKNGRSGHQIFRINQILYTEEMLLGVG